MTAHLHSVDPTGPPSISGTESGLPDFEGHTVNAGRIKLSGGSNLEGPAYPNHIDDIVRLFVEARVVRVDHAVDEPTGKLNRIQTIKIIDAIQLPWDYDTGAFRD